ncbi:hypothetical protein Bca52824_012309 [Brassica carinata]|uniref:Uncharacterized protein n=1 Tax=Brassica carinata TaxID=52824 RepID=A0A8X7VWQ9_BRACI|nr:hypothetical protein Bca52824_012309 [Brassica carinata]
MASHMSTVGEVTVGSQCHKLLGMRDFTSARHLVKMNKQLGKDWQKLDQVEAICDVIIAAENRLRNGFMDYYGMLRATRFGPVVLDDFRRLMKLLDWRCNGLPSSQEAAQYAYQAWSMLSKPVMKARYDLDISSPMVGMVQLGFPEGSSFVPKEQNPNQDIVRARDASTFSALQCNNVFNNNGKKLLHKWNLKQQPILLKRQDKASVLGETVRTETFARVVFSCSDREGLMSEVAESMKAADAKAVRAEMMTVGGRTKCVLFVQGVNGNEGLVKLKKALKPVVNRKPEATNNNNGVSVSTSAIREECSPLLTLPPGLTDPKIRGSVATPPEVYGEECSTQLSEALPHIQLILRSHILPLQTLHARTCCIRRSLLPEREVESDRLPALERLSGHG